MQKRTGRGESRPACVEREDKASMCFLRGAVRLRNGNGPLHGLNNSSQQPPDAGRISKREACLFVVAAQGFLFAQAGRLRSWRILFVFCEDPTLQIETLEV